MANRIYLNSLEKVDYAQREAFNSLRSNLMFCGAELKTLLFTSCNPNEGKSTVSFGLARSMAGNQKRVLYVDADMRKSVMMNRYQIQMEQKGQMGLTHFLSNQASLEDVIVDTNVEGLSMILTGPLSPNPTELLAGKRMDLLLEASKNHFDAVIIDSPPLGMVIDAAVLAPKCDGVILVIESDSVSRRAEMKVKKQLELTGCRILGAVLNKVGSERNGYYSKYGKYGKYGRYGRYGRYGYSKYGDYYGEEK
ncbi:MAG: polysaccharide biosynthesis tyrosine autokinase [Anaerovoracaceae bacterium]